MSKKRPQSQGFQIKSPTRARKAMSIPPYYKRYAVSLFFMPVQGHGVAARIIPYRLKKSVPFRTVRSFAGAGSGDKT